MKMPRLFVGTLLIALAVLVQVAFGMLAVNFNYPDILMHNAQEALTRFHGGGATLVWTWYVCALCLVGFFFVVVLFPTVIGQENSMASRIGRLSGVVAAVAQLTGLLRWSLVVPFLAERWLNHPEQHAFLEVAYELQHRLFGVMIGEHIGQLFLAVWTLSASVLLSRFAAPLWIAAMGGLMGVLFLGGLGAGLSRSVSMPSFVSSLPMVAFMGWSLWIVVVGVFVTRRAK